MNLASKLLVFTFAWWAFMLIFAVGFIASTASRAIKAFGCGGKATFHPCVKQVLDWQSNLVVPCRHALNEKGTAGLN